MGRGRAPVRPRLVEEPRVGVPVLVTGRAIRGIRADDLADRAFVDQRDAGLQPAAEERVRGASEHQSGCVGGGDERTSVVKVGRERLLGVHVLARLERSAGHRRMRLWGSEVRHDVDVGSGERLVRRARALDPVLRREPARAVEVGVGTGHDPHRRAAREVLRVLGCDLAAAHECDTEEAVSAHGAVPERGAGDGGRRRRRASAGADGCTPSRASRAAHEIAAPRRAARSCPRRRSRPGSGPGPPSNRSPRTAASPRRVTCTALECAAMCCGLPW